MRGESRRGCAETGGSWSGSGIPSWEAGPTRTGSPGGWREGLAGCLPCAWHTKSMPSCCQRRAQATAPTPAPCLPWLAGTAPDPCLPGFLASSSPLPPAQSHKEHVKQQEPTSAPFQPPRLQVSSPRLASAAPLREEGVLRGCSLSCQLSRLLGECFLSSLLPRSGVGIRVPLAGRGGQNSAWKEFWSQGTGNLV